MRIKAHINWDLKRISVVVKDVIEAGCVEFNFAKDNPALAEVWDIWFYVSSDFDDDPQAGLEFMDIDTYELVPLLRKGKPRVHDCVTCTCGATVL